MTDRIRQIAEAYAADSTEINKLEQVIRDLVRDEREACAKTVELFADTFFVAGPITTEQKNLVREAARLIRLRHP